MKRYCLICLSWVVLTTSAFGLSIIAPSSASGASIPYPYNMSIYTTWPSDPISISAISDGSAATFATLTGLDNVLQDNGFRVDTGTFYLFRYIIPLSAPAFHIDFTAAVQYPGGEDEFLIVAVDQDGVYAHTLHREFNASEPRTFGLTFYRNSNDGNQSAWGQAWGLDNMQQADGSINIVLQGSYYAQFDRPGFVSSTLYDVSASIVPVPEPATIALLGLGAFSLTLIKRRRN